MEQVSLRRTREPRRAASLLAGIAWTRHIGVRRYALRLAARDADVAQADLVAHVRRVARRRGARRAAGRVVLTLEPLTR